ncbi:WD40 repeat domain-containing protein [Actinomadura sp. 7K507]|uniref:WD40 repeat domain-containing protein n=1 Tax=Actinomadura sp. 7K507 TaxID=2530365 RepID=UPI0014045BAC|nr:WD40 repeat domain-containing protein [Actinomadura sp. 7K507]
MIEVRGEWDVVWAHWRPAARHALLEHPLPVGAVVAGTVEGRPVAVTGTNDGVVRVWDLAAERPEGVPMPGHKFRIGAAAITVLEGRPVAVTCGRDRTLRIWDLLEPGVTARVDGEGAWMSALAVGEVDGQCFAVTGGSNDGTVRIWDLAARRPACDPLAGHSGWVNAVATTGPVAISGGSDDGTIRRWDMRTGEPIGEPVSAHPKGVAALVAGDLDGTAIAVSTGYAETIARVWDVATGRPVEDVELDGEPHAIAMTDVEGRPRLVIGVGKEGRLHVWDLAARRFEAGPLPGPGSRVNAVATAERDGALIAVTSGDDGKARVWDMDADRPGPSGTDGSAEGHPGAVSAVALSTSGGLPVAVTGTATGTVQVWDLATGQALGDPLPGGGTCPVATVEPIVLDGHPAVVTGGRDRMVRIRGIGGAAGTSVDLRGVDAFATTVLDGRLMLIAGRPNFTTQVWSLHPDPAMLGTLTGHTARVKAIAAGRAKGRPIAVTLGHDSTVRLWDLRTLEPAAAPFSAVTGDGGYMNAMAIGELDGRTVLAAGSSDGTVGMRDLATALPLGDPVIRHAGIVNTVAVGRLAGRQVVASGADDDTVRIWDPSETMTRTLRLGSKVSGIAITEDGTLLIAAYAGIAHLRPT